MIAGQHSEDGTFRPLVMVMEASFSSAGGEKIVKRITEKSKYKHTDLITHCFDNKKNNEHISGNRVEKIEMMS